MPIYLLLLRLCFLVCVASYVEWHSLFILQPIFMSVALHQWRSRPVEIDDKSRIYHDGVWQGMKMDCSMKELCHPVMISDCWFKSCKTRLEWLVSVVCEHGFCHVYAWKVTWKQIYAATSESGNKRKVFRCEEAKSKKAMLGKKQHSFHIRPHNEEIKPQKNGA